MRLGLERSAVHPTQNLGPIKTARGEFLGPSNRNDQTACFRGTENISVTTGVKQVVLGKLWSCSRSE
jgi:hypothetical protein